MKLITITCIILCCLLLNVEAQKTKTLSDKYPGASLSKYNLDSMYKDIKHGNKQIRFIDEDKNVIRLVDAVIYSNGFISALIDYKDKKGQLLGTRYGMKAKRAGGEN